MTIFSYSFSLTPPALARQEYDSSEFQLDLAATWRQIPTQEENALNFQSDAHGAAVVISADFYDIPDDQALALAEQCISSRIDAHRLSGQAPLTVLQQGVKPHSSGAGLEMSYAAEAEGGHVYLYLGYVTSRKILNFSMICPAGRHEAVALFNATVPGFRPRLP